MAQCIVGAKTSFIDFTTATLDPATLLTTLPNETPSFNFSWSTRADRPQLSPTPGVVQLTGELSTSITYNQHEYFLNSIQFAKHSHAALVSPVTNQINNVEDVVLTFTDSNIIVGDQQHIIVIVPIIRLSSGLSVDADYLHAFVQPPTTPFTIQSLIPSGPFASYTICTPRQGVAASNQNIMILVSMHGLPTMTATMLTILQAQTLSAYIPPSSVVLGAAFNLPDTPVTDGMVIYNNIITMPAPPPAAVTEVTTNALKCVPLDPEKQIDNGKIRIDASTGKPLDNVQADRLDTMASVVTNTSIISPDTFVKGVSLFLGVFFFLIIGYLAIAFCVHYFVGASAAGSHGPSAALSRSMSKFTMPAYFTTGIFAGLCGVLLGYFLNKR